MELNQLHYFVEVARCENITRAAKELFITQPALSRVILRLEQELGTPLFDRHSGRVTLNEHGKAFPPCGTGAGVHQCRRSCSD